jgi:hypothetical protein
MLKVCDTIRIHAATTNDYVSIMAANAIEQRLHQVRWQARGTASE